MCRASSKRVRQSEYKAQGVVGCKLAYGNGRCPWLYVSPFAIEVVTRVLGVIRAIHSSECVCALIPERDLVYSDGVALSGWWSMVVLTIAENAIPDRMRPTAFWPYDEWIRSAGKNQP